MRVFLSLSLSYISHDYVYIHMTHLIYRIDVHFVPLFFVFDHFHSLLHLFIGAITLNLTRLYRISVLLLISTIDSYQVFTPGIYINMHVLRIIIELIRAFQLYVN